MKFFRKYHKWAGIILAIFLLLFSLSGIILNHRTVFSSYQVNRKLLPANYRYVNWNLAAVKGGLPHQSGYFLYGNIGVLNYDSTFTQSQPVHIGNSAGIDQQKTFKMMKTSSGAILAAGLYGLSVSEDDGATWKEVSFEGESHPVDLAEYAGKIYVLTRSEIIVFNNDLTYNSTIIPAPEAGYENKIGLFRTFWEIHSGEFLGIPGQLFVDLLGLVLIFLSLTGIIYFFAPNIIKKLKNQTKKSFSKFNRSNLKWHNYVGLYFGFFLLISVITGIFLRPPLLIPIANVEVSKIPFTHLDHPNPWYDKLRILHINPADGQVVMGTNEGLYLTDILFREVHRPATQPPVSVMGINVFEPVGESTFLVGSFNGLYSWDAQSGFIFDYLSGEPYIPQPVRGSPISSNMVAGYLKISERQEVLFDYNHGAISLNNPTGKWVDMPEKIIETPMSLWNLALEFHTGRIYESIIGAFYILFIPLAGLNILLLLISGILVWFKHYYKPKNSRKQQ